MALLPRRCPINHVHGAVIRFLGAFVVDQQAHVCPILPCSMEWVWRAFPGAVVRHVKRCSVQLVDFYDAAWVLIAWQMGTILDPQNCASDNYTYAG
jgi:hypothetical protein